MQKDGLYHKSLGLPPNVGALCRVYKLRYGRHALEAATNDRYGCAIPSQAIKVTMDQIVEVEVLGGQLVKMVVRQRYNDDVDIVLVVNPEDGFVRTLWFNKREDGHRTLQAGRYIKP